MVGHFGTKGILNFLVLGMAKKTSLLKKLKIFNLPQTVNAKKEALAAILKTTGVRDVATNMPTTTFPSLSLIESDKGHSLP